MLNFTQQKRQKNNHTHTHTHTHVMRTICYIYSPNGGTTSRVSIRATAVSTNGTTYKRLQQHRKKKRQGLIAAKICYIYFSSPHTHHHYTLLHHIHVQVHVLTIHVHVHVGLVVSGAHANIPANASLKDKFNKTTL